MAGIDFDRQAFVPPAEPAPRGPFRLLAPLVLVIVAGALGLAGFKLYSDYSRSAPAGDAQNLQQIQQQLASMEKRLDQLERHRRPAGTEPAAVPSKAESHSDAPALQVKRFAYKISPAVSEPAGTAPNRPANSAQRSGFKTGTSAAEESTEANHEAWQATTDRLADVAGVVGSQQGELSAAREDLNRLLALNRRSAVPFELHRGRTRQPVGPVSLLLKASDPRSQRYTVCVYLEDHCVELKDRVTNEVVVFVLRRNSAPLELVATKVLRDQIVGYLEVPVDDAAN